MVKPILVLERLVHLGLVLFWPQRQPKRPPRSPARYSMQLIRLDNNLADLLKSQKSSIGVLTNQTSSGAESLSSLNKEKDRLEERLNKIQAGYIAQYSNLNKLLFQLNLTSQSLTSALDGLKNEYR